MSLIDFTGFENGEMPSFVGIPGWGNVGSIGWSVTSSSVRTGSYCMASGANSPVTTPNGLYRDLDATEEGSEIIMGVAYNRAGFGTHTVEGIFHFLSDAGATAHISIVYNTAAGLIEARLGAGNGALLGSAVACPLADSYYYIETRVVLHDTAGEVEVRVDGEVLINLSGIDTKNGGTKTVIDRVMWGRGSVASSGASHYDDLYVLKVDATTPNNFLNAPKVQPMVPNGDGSTNQFVGSDGNSVSNWQNVDERPPSTADYNESSTAGNQDLYAMSDVAFQPTEVVKGVKAYLVVHNSDASTRDVKLGVRSGGTTDMDAGHGIGTGSAVRHVRLMPKNPVTSADWTQTEINALEAGVEVI